MRPDPALPAVFCATDLRKVGLTQEQAERRVRAGRWRRLGAGVYCTNERWAAATPEQRHELRARGLWARRGRTGAAAFSHQTAAALLGLPVPRRMLDRVTLTVPPGGGASARADPRVRRYVATLAEQDVLSVKGLPVTDPARTVVDCLRHLDALDAVPLADAALHQGLTTRHEIERVLRSQARWPLAGVAALTLPLVDELRESPLESRSAVVLHRYDVPAARCQERIVDHVGRFVARPDFTWRELRVIGEADGRQKYAAETIRVVEAEKERQARLEELGFVVVRWGAKDLMGEPPAMVRRVRAALRRGESRRDRVA